MENRRRGTSTTLNVHTNSLLLSPPHFNFNMTCVNIEISIPHVHRQGQPDGGRHHHHDPKGTYKQFCINSRPHWKLKVICDSIYTAWVAGTLGAARPDGRGPYTAPRCPYMDIVWYSPHLFQHSFICYVVYIPQRRGERQTPAEGKQGQVQNQPNMKII